ncbi:MAG: ATP-binding protein [Bacteroidia bacterium]
MRVFKPDDVRIPLPGPAVTDIYQDQQGYLWVYFYNHGLTRFNGIELQIIPDAERICGVVSSVCEDPLGRLWALGKKGIAVSTQPLKDFAPGDSITFTDHIGSVFLPKGESDPETKILRDNKDRLWIPVHNETIEMVRFSFIGVDSVKMEIIPNKENEKTSVTTLAQRNDGSVWAYSREGNLWVFKGDDISKWDSVPIKTKSETSVYSPDIKLLCEDSSGNLWIVTEDGSVAIWKTGDSTPGPWVSVFKQGKTKAILRTRDGNIWIAGSEGVARFNPVQFPRFTLINDQQGLPSPFVFSLEEDAEGNLWIGTITGMARISSDFDAFESFSDISVGNTPGVLPSAGAIALQADWPWAQGGVEDTFTLVATTNGLAAISSQGKRAGLLTKEEGLMANLCISLGIDNKNRLWIGEQAGVSCLAPVSRPLPAVFGKGQPLNWMGQPGLLYNFEIGFVLGILPLQPSSPKEPEILALIDQQGVALLTEDYILGFGPKNGLTGTGFRIAELDDQNYLYAGCVNGGLFRSTQPISASWLQNLRNTGSPVQKRGLEFAFAASDPDCFRHVIVHDGKDTVKSISSLLSHQGKLWITCEHGLWVYDYSGKNPEKRINIPEKYKNLQRLRLDPKSGLIWMATTEGLLAVDPDSGKIAQYANTIDGLLENGIWGPHAFQISKSGTFLYGTSKGLALYRPDMDQARPPLPKVVFTSIKQTSYEDGLQEIRFDYSALAYFWENNLQYRTRLLGYNSEWSPPTQETSLRYTNLPAFLLSREFSFEVEAGSIDGQWSGQPARFTFRVSPPWYFSWWFSAILILAGAMLIGWIIRLRTTEKEKELEKQREINERLEQIDRLKDQFLANTSHELRTPLNGIIGLSEGLLEREKDDEDRQNLGMIIASGKRLASLVNDLLDFSRLRNADLILRQRPIHLRSLADVVLQVSFPLTQGRNIILRNEIPTDLPAAFADEDRLTQILHNLVGNAIKFTESGAVQLSAKQKDNMLEIAVSDTGIGIPTEKQEIIFDAFEQGDGSISRQYSGTGLGLSITRQLVQRHGGQIRVESQPGNGATFFFTLPISAEKVQASTAPQITPLVPEFATHNRPGFPTLAQPLNEDRVQLLIVDDEPINHQVLRNHLRGDRFEIHTAMNGQEALNLLAHSTKPFDIILLDVMMPRMSGYEVARKIRETYLPSELPIIMITAKNQVADLVQGLETGANDYLAKPFSKDEFLARLHTHLNLGQINRASGRFVPNEFIQTLGYKTITEVKLGDHIDREVTVFFSDIRSYTTLAEQMTPDENFRFVNAYAQRMGPLIYQNGGFVNQYLGDGIMAIFQQSPANALQAAIDMQKALLEYNQQRVAQKRQPLRVGMGMHMGPLVMGIIGDRQRTETAVIADTVNTAARVEGLTKYYGANILLSEISYRNLPSGLPYHFRYLGLARLKGKEDAIGIYECMDGDDSAVLMLKQATLEDFDTGLNAYLNGDISTAMKAFSAVLSRYPEDGPASYFLSQVQQLQREGIPKSWKGIVEMEGK